MDLHFKIVFLNMLFRSIGDQREDLGPCVDPH